MNILRQLLVLLAGASLGIAQSAGTFTAIGDMTAPRAAHTATLLFNGKVLLAGGSSSTGAELYDPSTGRFTATGNMITARRTHTATLLADGTVLIAGGFLGATSNSFTASAEIYDPSNGTFTPAGEVSLTTTQAWHTATLLGNGKVLITGGVYWAMIPGSVSGTLSSAELYHPAVLAPVLGQGAILHAVTHQMVSPDNPAVAGEPLEIYLTGLLNDSVIPPQVAIGGRMAEVLFFGNAPGLPGVNQVNVRVPDSIAAGPAVPVRLIYLTRPSNAVSIAVGSDSK